MFIYYYVTEIPVQEIRENIIKKRNIYSDPIKNFLFSGKAKNTLAKALLHGLVRKIRNLVMQDNNMIYKLCIARVSIL